VESRKKFVKMVKNGYAQKYRQTAREIGGASPEKKGSLRCKGFTEKKGFKPEMKE